jgi:hypothetical protein
MGGMVNETRQDERPGNGGGRPSMPLEVLHGTFMFFGGRAGAESA